MKYSPKTETEFRKLITTKIKLYNSLRLKTIYNISCCSLFCLKTSHCSWLFIT